MLSTTEDRTAWSVSTGRAMLAYGGVLETKTNSNQWIGSAGDCAFTFFNRDGIDQTKW